MEIAQKTADRVIFIDEGKIIEDADKIDYSDSPSSEYAQLSCRKFCRISGINLDLIIQ